jgi:C1A family cysteine protease
MKKLIVLGICLLAMGIVSAQSDELQQLQQILTTTRASWTAGETFATRLSMEERKNLLGLIPGVYNPSTLPEPTIDSTPVRESFGNLKDTPIKDQGQCGSCYSFGACAAYEGWKLNTAGLTYDLSEQYFMMKAKESGNYGGCSGWWLDLSMNLLRDNGVADESKCKYLAYESACPGTATPTYKIKGYTTTTDKATIQKAIDNGRPVYVGFAVYNDFFNYSGGYYTYTSGGLAGYHAVCIIGYDGTGFKVKNSWGTGWGESGYFRIAYSQMTNSVQFGTCFGGSFYITD